MISNCDQFCVVYVTICKSARSSVDCCGLVFADAKGQRCIVEDANQIPERGPMRLADLAAFGCLFGLLVSDFGLR
jgi:hypothetical protein